jgi:uncharacterized protein (DUF4415 family)
MSVAPTTRLLSRLSLATMRLAPPANGFETADLYDGNKLVRRGRPKSEAPKQATSLRLDPDVLEHYRATGPGWQSRINQALRKAAGLGKR